jgi:protein SCO1/2
MLLLASMAAGIGAGVGLAHFGRSGGSARDAASLPGLLWPPRGTLPDFALTDQHGTPFTATSLRGRWSLVFFGFTRCPDVCPNTLAALAQARAGLAGVRKDFSVVFVSVDPDRDPPGELGSYVEHFDPAFVGVTGPTAELDRLTRALGVIYAKAPLGGGDYSVDHSAAVLVIDPRARFVGVLSAPHDARHIVDRALAIRAYVEGQS